MTGAQFQALLDKHELRHVDAARLLDVATKTIARYAAAGKVPAMAADALRWHLLRMEGKRG